MEYTRGSNKSKVYVNLPIMISPHVSMTMDSEPNPSCGGADMSLKKGTSKSTNLIMLIALLIKQMKYIY